MNRMSMKSRNPPEVVIARALSAWKWAGVLCVMCAGTSACALAGDAKEVKQDDRVTVEEAVSAGTDATLLQDRIKELDARVLRLVNTSVTKGVDAVRTAKLLVAKERYPEALEAYEEAITFFNEVLAAPGVLAHLAKTQREVTRDRILAESIEADAAKMKEGRRHELDASGFAAAGAFDLALERYKSAWKVYHGLLKPLDEVELRQAVEARDAALAMRKGIDELPALDVESRDPLDYFLKQLERTDDPGTESHDGVAPRTGSIADLRHRAIAAETAAQEAWDARDHTPAYYLYKYTAELFRKIQQAQAALEGARGDLALALQAKRSADYAFDGESRPVSFVQGEQELDDGQRKLRDGDLQGAKKHFAEASRHFAEAEAKAAVLNELSSARHKWAAVDGGSDESLLDKYVADKAAAARDLATLAQTRDIQGKPEEAARLYKEASAALDDAIADAMTQEHIVQAQPIISKLREVIAGGDRFAAESYMSELRRLIPKADELKALSEQVEQIAWPKELTVSIGEDDAMEFVLIPAGSFNMGSKLRADERPVREVTIAKPFYLGKYEVTQSQWTAVMATNPSRVFKAGAPVTNVGWTDCQTFCEKLGTIVPNHQFRLPSEAEWEYAARAGSTTEYCFGDDPAKLTEYAWYTWNAGGEVQPVGAKLPNAWGLHDMHGNVWEWCQDTHFANYVNAPVDGSAREDPRQANARVLRGGGWLHREEELRSAARSRWRSTGGGTFYHGLRIVAAPR